MHDVVEGMYTKHRPRRRTHAVPTEQANAHPPRVIPRKVADCDDRKYRSDAEFLREHSQHAEIC